MARTLVTIAVVAALAVALAQARQPAQPAQAAPSASPGTVQVNIVSESLPSLSVTFGDRVTWTNLDDDVHTSTSGQDGVPTSFDGVGWNSGILDNGDSYSYTFNKVGSFPYTCLVHPFTMNATVNVKPPPPPTPTPLPTRTPKPTATPFPEFTVVLEAEITAPAGEGGSVTVVHPTSPVDITLPQHGVRLRIPAPVQSETFQVRLRVVDPGSLPGQRDMQVLRAVHIDLFDGNGNPKGDVRFWFKAKFSLTLTDSEVQEMGGLGYLLNEFSTGRLALRRLSRGGRSWSDIHTLFDIHTNTFSASTAHFSTIGLTLSRRQSLSIGAATPAPAPLRAPGTGDPAVSRPLLLALVSLGAALVLGGGLLLSLLRRRV